jgi:hypothetical protein
LRTPFLDREVMAVAARLSRAEKTAAGTTKFALREAIGTLLPHESVDQAQANRGFAVPIGHWFRGELSGFAEQVIREARTDDWLDKRAVLDVLRRFRAGDPEVPWRHLWVLVVFSLWHQIYVERVFDPVALGWQSSRQTGQLARALPAAPEAAVAVPPSPAPPPAVPHAPVPPPPALHPPAPHAPVPQPPRQPRFEPRPAGPGGRPSVPPGTGAS